MFTYKTELELHNHILDNFNSFFPYTLLANEYELQKGRVDFLAEDEENLYIIEIKKDFINRATINQLKKYMNSLKEMNPNKNIIGIASAPTFKKHLKDIEIPKDIILHSLDNVNYVGKIRTLLVMKEVTKSKLEIQAKQQNRSLNNLIETIIEQYLKERA